jgi:atypical dual specificity phosphatase
MSEIVLQNTRGVLGLVGPSIDDLATGALESAQRLMKAAIKHQPPYHVTLFTKAELRGIPSDRLDKLQADTRYIHSAGIGGNPDTGILFMVIIWAAGQHLRKQFGLPPKHFHITLSTQDNHDMDKGIDSLLPDQFPSTPTPDFLDHLAFTLHAFGLYQRAQEFCKDLILALPQSHRGFLRMADAALWGGQHKLAMLSFACAYERSDDQKAQTYCVKKLIECSKYTEWGHVILEDEIPQIPVENASTLLAPWSTDLRLALSDLNVTPLLMLEPRQSLFIPSPGFSAPTPFYKLPRFFRWLIPYHIAIMSTPRREEDISALSSPHLGIRHVLTLTEETPLQESWFRGMPITNTYLPIPNYYPPSIEQMDLIMRLFEDEEKLPLLVHCGGGKGRAGTVAACYIAAFGFGKPHLNQEHPELSAPEAISLLRHIRPGSIETSQQEAFVSKWCSTIWKRQSVYPDVPSEPPPCSLVIEGTLGNEHDLFMLVGLPGSGKSWFSRSLLARDPTSWTLISQDDSGSRSTCESEIGRAHGRVLLDRCNTAASDRRSWLELASKCTSLVCVWFDYNRELCTSRAQMRAGHPTLPPGSRVRNAIEQMQKIFVRPRLNEGFKAVVIVRSFAAAQELVLRLSPSITIFKFPRTPHLINLGAASSDDIITDVAALPHDGHVVITEKIDGANMGFSLSSDRSRIIVQNRSHYVDSSTHEQFKKLGIWVERHEGDLFKILDRDPFFAERYILFGEWMFATHSIPYTRLPGRFLAFDLYDRSTRTWADTKLLSGLLASTSISPVPVLYDGTMPSDSELRDMVQGQSKFWDGRVEGVYVKVERDGCVVSRGKVVRSDFIAGNEHWGRGNLRVNGIENDAFD